LSRPDFISKLLAFLGRNGDKHGTPDTLAVPGGVPLRQKVLIYLPFVSEFPYWISNLTQQGFQVEVRLKPDLPPPARRPDVLLIDTSDKVDQAVQYLKRAQAHFGGQPLFIGVLVHSPDLMRTHGKRFLDAGASRVFQPTTSRGAQILIGLKIAFTPCPFDSTRQPSEASSPMGNAAPTARKGQILIVADDPIVASLLAKILEAGGFATTVVAGGEAALSLLDRSSPAVVLLDVLLPGLNGLELVRRLHAPDLSGTALPVVVFTGALASVSELQLLEAGATRVYRKSDVDPHKLLATFNSLVRSTASDKPTQALAKEGIAVDATSTMPDPAFFAEIQEVLLQQAPTISGELLRSLGEVAHDESPDQAKMRQLHRNLHSLSGNAGLAGLSRVSTMAGALASLVDELLERNTSFNHSIRRTLTQGIELITELFGRADEFMPATIPVLAVDDEEVSRRVLSHALHKVDLRPTILSSPEQALAEVRARRYDLIFLDVEMPGLSGLELCRRIRELPAYRLTPVVFVTSKDSLEISTESARSGGTDFIKKPFGLRELAVKALIYLLEQPGTPPLSA
jgi:DNA-binding response OmpR family regulator